jgi:hypothetical protein
MPTVDTRPPHHRHPENGDPAVAATPSPVDDGIWFEQIESSPEYSLRFRTKGHGPTHSLVPLNQIMDERYSVYLKNITTT